MLTTQKTNRTPNQTPNTAIKNTIAAPAKMADTHITVNEEKVELIPMGSSEPEVSVNEDAAVNSPPHPS